MTPHRRAGDTGQPAFLPRPRSPISLAPYQDEDFLGTYCKKWNSGNVPSTHWEQTYQKMAQEQENWDDFDVTLLDGLEGEGLDSEKI